MIDNRRKKKKRDIFFHTHKTKTGESTETKAVIFFPGKKVHINK
jgi:hypothetical protein